MRNVLMLPLVGLLAGCGDAASPPVIPQLDIIAGDAQVDTVARRLAQTVVARATSDGGVVPQVVVNWYRIAGPDTVFAGAGLTDALGEARFGWTLMTTAGPQSLVGWVLDAAGDRQDYARATATALHDRATVVLGSRADTVTLAVGAPLFDHDSYSAAYDRFGNWAGRLHWQPATGWRVSADTAWCDVPGLYTMRLALDDVTSSLTVRVQ